MTLNDDITEALIYAEGGPALSRRTAGRLALAVDQLNITVSGCACPAPYTECPHDEPLLSQVRRLEGRLDVYKRACRKLTDPEPPSVLYANPPARRMLRAVLNEPPIPVKPGYQGGMYTSTTIEPLPHLILPRCQYRAMGRQCAQADRHQGQHRLMAERVLRRTGADDGLG